MSETPHFSNAAFRYGMGLFETMLVRDGAIRFAQSHWDRLFAGMTALGFDIPVLFTKDYLEEQVLRTVNRNGLQSLCRVRLQIFGAGGGLYDREHNRPLFLVECYSLSPEILQFNENGLEVGIAHGLAKANDAISNFKTTSALVYAMAAQVAKQQKWNDALILNTAGNIIESTIANIFWVKGSVLSTPLLSEGCVAGVMRRHLLETIPGISEEILTPTVLAEADEVFLANSIRGIRWVGRFGDRKYSNAFSRQLFTSLP
ncbi:MAG: aminotransferase class IV [Taibaiella sp.]|nr:aminotransferase class IV [Taibaiella sp.]